jgi:hypothetical protein
MRQDEQLTWFERNLAERMKDAEFATAYEQARKEIADAVAKARAGRLPLDLTLTWKHLGGPTAESVIEQLKALGGDWIVEDADGLVVRKCAEVEAWMAEAYRTARPDESPVSWDASYHAALSALR